MSTMKSYCTWLISAYGSLLLATLVAAIVAHAHAQSGSAPVAYSWQRASGMPPASSDQIIEFGEKYWRLQPRYIYRGPDSWEVMTSKDGFDWKPADPARNRFDSYETPRLAASPVGMFVVYYGLVRTLTAEGLLSTGPLPHVAALTREPYLGYTWRIGAVDNGTLGLWRYGVSGAWEQLDAILPDLTDYTLDLSATNSFMLLIASHNFDGTDRVYRSLDGLAWEDVSSGIPWSSDHHVETVSYGGRIWVPSNSCLSDCSLWSTDNGKDWEVFSYPPQAVARSPILTKFLGQLALINNGGLLLTSPDGITWTNLRFSPFASSRIRSATTTFAGHFWVLGGATSGMQQDMNDVWRTANGVTWEQVSSSAPWSSRHGATAFALDGYLWICGGRSGSTLLNDIWRSQDGVQWEQMTGSAAWEPRHGASAVLNDGLVWLLGGERAASGQTGPDVWKSTNGVDWHLVADNQDWGFGSYFSASVDEGRIHIAGNFGCSTGWRVLSYYSTDGVNWPSGRGTPSDCILSEGENEPTPIFSEGASLTSAFGRLVYTYGSGRYDYGCTRLCPDRELRQHIAISIDGKRWIRPSVDLGEGHDFASLVALDDKLVYLSAGDAWVSEAPRYSDYDTNSDGSISVDEVLRLIQLYNSDGFHCDPSSEDGFAPGPGDRDCDHYSADHMDTNWDISISEVLRAVQLYNSSGYYRCATGEDGFCAGASPGA